MRALFDVNALIALFTPDHPRADQTHQWLQQHEESGWATCPLTENGFVRVTSQPSFPQFRPIRDAVSMLDNAIKAGHHAFWPDNISITDTGLFDHAKLHGHRQITDAYLLALAVRNGGRLVTFDKRMTIESVRDAKQDHLIILG